MGVAVDAGAGRGHRRDRGHGRVERRTIKVVTVRAGLKFPHAAQAIQIVRRVRRIKTRRWTTVTVYAITSVAATKATPAQHADWTRRHWSIENSVHWVRDVTYADYAVSGIMPTASWDPLPRRVAPARCSA